MVAFDPETFMQQTVDGPLETEYTLVPEGEYQALIADFTSEAFEQIDFIYKKGQRAGQPGSMTKFNVPFSIQDDKVKQEIGRDTVLVYKSLNLDVGDDGSIQTGKNKNIELGRIQKAAGQDKIDHWNVTMLRGAGPLLVKVVHREGDRKDGSKWKRAEVDQVVSLR